jgi:ABC-type nitrate/sulfonate/bicarbonate transport system permease component
VNSSGAYWLWDYGRRRWGVRLAIRVLAFAVFFLAWELVGRSERYFAVVPATTTFARLLEDLGPLTEAMLGTLRAAALGYLLAVLVGLSAGTLVGLSRLGRAAIDPLITVGVVAPMTMLVPVIGIYVGLSDRGKVFLVFMFAVFAIAINTSAGVREVPPALVETGSAFGIRGWRLYNKVVAPSALPYMLTGLRLGAGRAVQGAIIADLLLEVKHMGGYLVRAGSTFDMPALLAGTFFTVVVASGVMLGARAAERRLLRWLPT